MLTFFFQSAEVSVCYYFPVVRYSALLLQYLNTYSWDIPYKTWAKSVCYPGPLPSALITLFSNSMKIGNYLALILMVVY